MLTKAEGYDNDRETDNLRTPVPHQKCTRNFLPLPQHLRLLVAKKAPNCKANQDFNPMTPMQHRIVAPSQTDHFEEPFRMLGEAVMHTPIRYMLSTVSP